jgi:Spy/CpxP family protein refolding chaperone
MRSIVRLTLPTIALALFIGVANVLAQSPQDPQPNPSAVRDTPNLLEQLHMTPDQIQKIRQIQRQMKDEQAAIGDRLREANRSLEEALDAETLDENLIEQRMQALSAAQNAQMRMRIQREVRIRRVLNPEQLAIWRDLRLKAGDLIRAQQNERRPLRPGAEGLRPNQRNGIVPFDPRRNAPIRNPRP